MDAPPKPLLVLADRLIRQFVDHLVSATVEIKDDDFMAIRVVFRKLGGNWEKVLHGDIVQITLLSKVAVAWGNKANKAAEDKK